MLCGLTLSLLKKRQNHLLISMYTHSKNYDSLKNLLKHYKLCGILNPEFVWIELLPDLVFAVGFFQCWDRIYTNPLSRDP